MSRRHKHPPHEEHENHEAWVIPYADMLTLLMGLFLVMWSIGRTDVAKMKAVGAGFASEIAVFNDGGGSGSEYNPLAEDPPLTGTTGTGADAQAALAAAEQAQADRAVDQQQLAAVKADLESRVQAAGISDQVSFRIEPRGLVVVVADGLLFDSGSAQLAGSARSTLEAVAGPLRDSGRPLVVEGHTDNQPVSGGRFETNWELSTARATAVLRDLIDRFGFPSSQLAASGFAETVPLADNATPEGRAKNRRVEILVAAATAVTSAPAAAPTSGASTPPATTFDPIGDPLAASASSTATEG